LHDISASAQPQLAFSSTKETTPRAKEFRPGKLLFFTKLFREISVVSPLFDMLQSLRLFIDVAATIGTLIRHPPQKTADVLPVKYVC
jgi:hypothetical protein